jgi:hypothetical protein
MNMRELLDILKTATEDERREFADVVLGLPIWTTISIAPPELSVHGRDAFDAIAASLGVPPHLFGGDDADKPITVEAGHGRAVD